MSKSLVIIFHILLILTNSIFGANKALFVHGFDSDAGTWADKDTPQDFENPPDGQTSIISESESITYDIFDFATNGYSATDIQNSIEDQIAAVINDSDDNWIIVAHSLGGIFSRGAIPKISDQSKIKGFITLGTPHQGAPAANVQDNDAQGFINTFSEETLAGPNVGASMWSTLANIFSAISNWELEPLVAILYTDDFIVAGYEEAKGYIGDATTYNVRSFLGPQGDWITNLPQLDNIAHRAIFGAEKSPTMIRWLSEFNWAGTEGYIEPDYVKYYEEIKDWYSDNYWTFDNWVNWYEIGCWEFFDVDIFWNACDNLATARYKRSEWKKGVDAWNNIDVTWSEVIGAGAPLYYTTIPTWHPREWFCDPSDWDPAIRDGSFDFESLFLADWVVTGDCYWEEGYYTYQTVATPASNKNDGLIQPNAALWNVGDEWTPDNLDNMRNQDNYYYSDTEANGGWNHSEIIRYTRIYDEPEAGTANTPLQRNADWMRLRFGN